MIFSLNIDQNGRGRFGENPSFFIAIAGAFASLVLDNIVLSTSKAATIVAHLCRVPARIKPSEDLLSQSKAHLSLDNRRRRN